MWRNRIVGYTEEPPDQLLANPRNPRRHPGRQRDVMRAVLDDIGFMSAVIVNSTTGHVVDGHLRIEEALSAGTPTVPVLYVELTEAEELEALATFDPITNMAVVDQDRLDELLADIDVDSEVLNAMLAEMAAAAVKVDAGPPPHLGELSDVKTFVVTLTEEQYAELWGVLRHVPGDTTADKVLWLARRYC